MSALLVASRPDTPAGSGGEENAPVPAESVALTRSGARRRALRVGPRARPGSCHRIFGVRRRRRRDRGPHQRLRRGRDVRRRSDRWLLDRHRRRHGHAARRGPGAGIPRAVRPAALQAHRRHGAHAGRRRLLARGLRRRHLQLRRRHVLRLHGVHPPQPADRRHGGDPRRSRLLARRLRRRHLQLRRRRLLRLHGVHPSQPGHRRHGRHARTVAATGSSPPTAASSTTATPRSTGRRGPSDSTSPSWAWPPRPTAPGTGWWPPTAGSSPSATPGTTGRRRGRASAPSAS